MNSRYIDPFFSPKFVVFFGEITGQNSIQFLASYEIQRAIRFKFKGRRFVEISAQN